MENPFIYGINYWQPRLYIDGIISIKVKLTAIFHAWTQPTSN